MKWTPIEKAKVIFKQAYLVQDATHGYEVAYLEEIKQTEEGLKYKFFDGEKDLSSITHVAFITDPTKE